MRAGSSPTPEWSVSARNRPFGRSPGRPSGFLLECEISFDQRANKTAAERRQPHGRESRLSFRSRIRKNSESLQIQLRETHSVRKSTTNMVAPAAQARGNRDVKRLPSERRTPKRANRPEPAPQLQHADGESKVHLACCHFRRPSRRRNLKNSSSYQSVGEANNFENTSRCKILQCPASE